MNSKTINLYMPPRTKKINLYITSACPSVVISDSSTYIYARALFDDKENYFKIVNTPLDTINHISNYGFELGSGSVATNWTATGFPQWERISGSARLESGEFLVNVHSGSYCENLIPSRNGEISTLTSASFAINALQLYRTSGYFLAKNGLKKTISSSVSEIKVNYTPIEPVFKAKIEWYNTSSELIKTDYFIEDEGMTTDLDSINSDSSTETNYDLGQKTLESGAILYLQTQDDSGGILTETLQQDGTYSAQPFWKYYKSNITAPATSASAKIVIEGYCPIVKSSDMLLYLPKIYLDDLSMIIPSTRVEIFPTAPISETVNFTAEFEDSSTLEGANTLIFSASSAGGSYDDCTGNTSGTGYFSTSTEYLQVGKNSSGIPNKSWMPFKIDFGTQDKAIKIYSAFLDVTASEDKKKSTGDEDCHIVVGFDSDGSSVTMPTSWTTLNGKTVTANPSSGSITVNWEAGTGYLFNITRSAKKIFGDYGVTWTNNNMVGVLAKTLEANTESNQWRKFASIENPYYPPPQLELTYAAMSYSACAVDTWIGISKDAALLGRDATTANTNHYGDDTGYIMAGFDKADQRKRGLIYFDLNFIGGSTAISGGHITSADLYMYCDYMDASVVSTRDIKFDFHEMLVPWDASSSTWEMMHGMRAWSGSPGGFHGDDCNTSASCGSFTVHITAGDKSVDRGWKTTSIDKTLVDTWISSASSNFGLMMKENSEDWYGNADCFGFVSSQNTTQTYRPYLRVQYTDSRGNAKDVSVKSSSETLG